MIKQLRRRNTEKRKEKARYAARKRRGDESRIFAQMSDLLPVSQRVMDQMDKSSIVRIAINFIKMRHFVTPLKQLFASREENELMAKTLGAMEAMNSLIVVLSRDGDMVYISDNVNKYLGLTDIDLMGQSVYDYCHPCDHNDIKQLLATKDSIDANDNSLFIRMKCTLTNKGRNLNLKSAPYKVIHFTGHLISVEDEVKSTIQTSPSSRHCFVIIGELLEHPYSIERPLSESLFVSRHSLDMKYTNVDERVRKYVGYNQNELLGKSIYNFFHSFDLPHLECFFKTLFAKGQCESKYYRYLAKFGGHVCLLTQATVITDNPTAEPQCVICINHVISGSENEGRIITSEEQSSNIENVRDIANEVKVVVEEKQRIPSKPCHSIISSTQSVFAPKTADMESGFIVFTNEANDMTILQDAEDLTHLAPEAGDVSVPLDVPSIYDMDLTDLNLFEDLYFQECNGNSMTNEEKLLRANDENMQFMRANDVQDLRYNDLYKGKCENELTHGISEIFPSKFLVQNYIKNPNANKDVDLNENITPSPNDPFLCFTRPVISHSPSTISSSDDFYSSSQSNSPTLNTPSPVLSQSSNYYCESPSYEGVSKLHISEIDHLNANDSDELDMRDYNEEYTLMSGEELIYSINSNIEDLIDIDSSINRQHNIETNANEEKLSVNTGHNCNYLAMLLQSEIPLKPQKLNHSPIKLNTARMKNIKNSMSKDMPSVLPLDNSLTFNNNYHFTGNHVNQSYNAHDLIERNHANGYFAPQKCNNGTNTQIICSTNPNNGKNGTIESVKEMISNKNNSAKLVNGIKRPLPSEPPDIMFSFCSDGVIRKGRPKLQQNNARLNKRIKMNDSQLKESSVLMNLLVNGEDITNGYSKYSFGDKVPQTHIARDNAYNYHKYSNTKKCSKHVVLCNGYDVR